MALQDAPAAQQIAQQASQLVPWFPVFTFLLGQLFAIVLAWLNARTTASREREARLQARNEAIEDRRLDLQRQNLLDLQDAMYTMVREAGRTYAADVSVSIETQTWRTQTSTELAADARDAWVKVAIYQSRVLDVGLRELVGRTRNAVADMLSAPSFEKAKEAINTIGDDYDVTNTRLGELLRALL
jgi:hypothetical protein